MAKVPVFEVEIKQDYRGSSPRKHRQVRKDSMARSEVGGGVVRAALEPLPAFREAFTTDFSSNDWTGGNAARGGQASLPTLIEVKTDIERALADLKDIYTTYLAPTAQIYPSIIEEITEDSHMALEICIPALNTGYHSMGSQLSPNPFAGMSESPSESVLSGDSHSNFVTQEQFQQTTNSMYALVNQYRNDTLFLRSQVSEQLATMSRLQEAQEQTMQNMQTLCHLVCNLQADNQMLRYQLQTSGCLNGHQAPLTDQFARKRTAPTEASVVRDVPAAVVSAPQSMAAISAVGDHTGPLTSTVDGSSAKRTKVNDKNAKKGDRAPRSFGKRPTSDMSKLFPHPRLVLPALPLTDGEIIIYFFNSVARPIVALRLYSRGWSPMQITDLLNKHRRADPPYLRNTCGVKCSTALKNGQKIYGEDWAVTNRTTFASANDAQATDMLRVDAEKPLNEECDVSALVNGLNMHAEEEDEGIFTRCVKYCLENNIKCRVSELGRIAEELKKKGMGLDKTAGDVVVDLTGDADLFRSPDLQEGQFRHSHMLTPATFEDEFVSID